MGLKAGVQILVVKSRFREVSKGLPAWRIPPKHLADFFFFSLKPQHEAQPALGSAYRHHPFSCMVNQGIETAKVNTGQFQHSVWGWEVVQWIGTRPQMETLQSYLVPGGTESLREAELAGKGIMQLLLLQPCVIWWQCIPMTSPAASFCGCCLKSPWISGFASPEPVSSLGRCCAFSMSV